LDLDEAGNKAQNINSYESASNTNAKISARKTENSMRSKIFLGF
jgi:hypothetical protein